MRTPRPLSLTTSLCSVAIVLAACGAVPKPLYLLHSQMVMESPEPPQQEAPADSVKPVMVVISDDYEVQIKLIADNLMLKQELADALKQNTKLKKQLTDEIRNNSLLKDLAVRRMSMN